MEKLKEIEMFLLDMDGTVFVEDQVIDGAIAFVEELKKQGKQYVFLTNNSSKNVDNYVEKLSRFQIPVQKKNIFISSEATALYLKEKKENAHLYVVGTTSLKKEFQRFGFIIEEDVNSPIDFLVVGYDTELTYAKLVDACFLLNQGIEYIATHPDLVCPVKNKQFIPDCGAICNMLEEATGRIPEYMGKPKRQMIDIISKKYGVPLEKMAMVGDRLYTDIACGNNAGITSICVLSGETNKEMLETSKDVPTYVLNSVKDIYNIIKS